MTALKLKSIIYILMRVSTAQSSMKSKLMMASASFIRLLQNKKLTISLLVLEEFTDLKLEQRIVLDLAPTLKRSKLLLQGNLRYPSFQLLTLKAQINSKTQLFGKLDLHWTYQLQDTVFTLTMENQAIRI